MASKWRAFRRVVQRRREFREEQLETSNLKRCLTGWDLTALGLGSTLGVGVYVLVGSVALKVAGPSIVLSFLIAAIASIFAGLCYAEFGARVPRAGSAYIYTYVTVGELLAFIVGWSNILESMFGTASVARGLSLYVDSMVNNSMSGWFAVAAPISAEHFSPYFDVFAFLVVLFLGVLLAFGVRESSMVNNVFTVVNSVVILFIIFAGAFQANSANWSIPESELPVGFGTGGFLPYGVLGMFRGAAICFYGFVGFDSISASGEEVKQPRRTIPIAILTVLGIVFVAYASVATVVTMMVPYYLQDTTASVATAFSYVGWEWARWIVTVGAIFGISASLFGAMFPLPRLLYAMSSDGLLFHWFARISVTRKSPATATVVPAIIIALLAGLLDLEQLVMLMCIGTLFSYTIVAVCVIVLRYRTSSITEEQPNPTKNTYFIVIMVLLLYICASISSAMVWRFAENIIVPLSLVNVVVILLMAIMTLQPKVETDLPFKTPLVPIVPCLSIYFNVHLMVFINVQTWIRVLIWIAIGIPIYIICVCCYKRNKTSNLEENVKSFSHTNKNGKSPIQIIIESPTPPDTMERPSNTRGDNTKSAASIKIKATEKQNDLTKDEILPYEAEDIQHAAAIDTNEEREAKIIDLLDKVLQAEEDTFGEVVSLQDSKVLEDHASNRHDVVMHRKSLSQLSDAGSEASLGNDILSKYDVVAQVHREDLPRVMEEISDGVEPIINFMNDETREYESTTAFNDDSDTNSRTDESGYSDTIDKTALNGSTDDVENIPYIPPPPPLDENFFANFTIPHIVANPNPIVNFKKSYTVPKRPSKTKEQEEESKPRESIQSNTSQGDSNLVFGSDRQINFLSKLNNIFQSRVTDDGGGIAEEQRRRSNSTGNVPENLQFAAINRPSIFLDLNKEIRERESAQNLRPVNREVKSNPEIVAKDNDIDDGAMSKDALKSKLESIFSNGSIVRPRLVKSNSSTPEETNQTDNNSSTDSIPKPPKMEKNDTLKRQKARYNEVLNSIRLSISKADAQNV